MNHNTDGGWKMWPLIGDGLVDGPVRDVASGVCRLRLD